MNLSLTGGVDFDNFCQFATYHIDSTDIDPVYPVLANTYQHFGLSRTEQLWFTYLYVTFYNLDSAAKVFNLFPKPQIINADLRYPTGTERRGFRGNDLAMVNINCMVEIANANGGLLNWVDAAVWDGRTEGWELVRQQFQSITGNGPWSSYKWADLIKNVHKFPITAPDIGVGGNGKNAGPVPGMVMLTGEDWQVCATDTKLQNDLMSRAIAKGVPYDGLDQLETTLCDWNSLCHGRYYIGHDIDQMQQQLALDSIFWAARLEAIPEMFLGELNGWSGVRPELKKLYSVQGVLEWWT